MNPGLISYAFIIMQRKITESKSENRKRLASH